MSADHVKETLYTIGLQLVRQALKGFQYFFFGLLVLRITSHVKVNLSVVYENDTTSLQFQVDVIEGTSRQ